MSELETVLAIANRAAHALEALPTTGGVVHLRGRGEAHCVPRCAQASPIDPTPSAASTPDQRFSSEKCQMVSHDTRTEPLWLALVP